MGPGGRDTARCVRKNALVTLQGVELMAGTTPNGHAVEPIDLPRCSDAGNARRFANDHRGDVLYCAPLKTWFLWDGRRFARDESGDVMRLAKATAGGIIAEAQIAADEASRRELLRHALKSESEPALRHMLTLAQSEPGIGCLPSHLDADPWILNTPSGVVDLRTGGLRPAKREDRCTKITAAPYEPDARHPVWESFLDRVLPDTDVQAFVERVAGYCLTGDVSEEKVFFVHGPAASGKSTLLNALRITLGDYGAVADFASFTDARGDGPKEDIARLAGKRLVTSIEVKDGSRLAEGLVKWLSGGDIIAARHLYSATLEFAPRFKLLLAANHRPRARDDDDALKRRILEVPFVETLPEAERDPAVKLTLCDPAQAGSAILRWAVDGLIAWRRVGLSIPTLVTSATESYWAQMDPLADFFADACVFESEAEVTASELRTAYEAWGKDNGLRHLVRGRAFGERLRARGCIASRSGASRSRGWQGIRLRTLLDAEPADTTP